MAEPTEATPTTLLELPDGRTLACDDVGDPEGTPVIYVHGTPDSRLARHPDDSVAAALGVRLVAVDRPGFGHSSAHPSGTVGSFGRDVANLAEHLRLAEVAVLGWSAGALPALAVAACSPDLVAAVGVAAGLPPVGAYGEPAILEDADAGRQILVEMGAELGTAATAAELAPYLVPNPITVALAREHLLESADEVRRAELESVPGALDAMGAAMVDAVRSGTGGISHDIELQLSEPDIDLTAIGCPVILWYGTADTTAPPSFGRWYGEHLAHADLRVLPGAGHCFPLPRWAHLLSELVAVDRPWSR